MSYIAPIHRPSSVRHAIGIKLLADEEESLVLAKSNRIEIWQLRDGGLSLLHTKDIYGTISMLQRLRPKDSPVDILFVGTDRFQYFTVAWNSQTSQLDTIQDFHDVGEKHMRDSLSQDKCLVDPSGRFMAMHLWEGVLTVLRLLTRKGTTLTLEYMEQVRLTELFMKASTFLYSETGHPKIAFLYQSRSDMPDSKLSIYRLTQDDKNTVASRFDPDRDREWALEISDPGATILIPVRKSEDAERRYNVRNPASAKAHLGGLIVVGETRLIYIDNVTHATVESPLKEASIFVAWAEYDLTHYFLGDDYGSMHLLTILTEGDAVTEMDVSFIGKTSRANCLVYLGNDMLFVGSHYGDSQLYRISFEDSSRILQLVQVMPNIAPILDFAIMDMGNREGDSLVGNEYSSGQARLVTGSGAHADGTLRSVRSGVGLEDVGFLADLDDIRGLFSVRSDGSERVDTLIVSFLTESRVFKFDSSEDIEELEQFQSISLSSQTLLASNLPNRRLLQVTAEAVLLIDLDSGVTVSSWKPAGGGIVTSASANQKWVLLSVDGRSITSLNLERDLAMGEQKELGETDQVACLHAAPQLPDVGVIGLWLTGSISIVNLETLEQIRGESLRRGDDNASIPRDIVLAQVLPPSLGSMSLFVSMEDGNVVTFGVSMSDFALSGRKSVVLGTRQARFSLLPRPNDTYNIFTTSEHPSLIYGSEGRIVYSAVTAEDATCVCPFDTATFQDCIAVATSTSLKISQIDIERRTHVQSLEMGETIRRIAYSPSEKLFGLGCIKRELIAGNEIVTSSFKLVDDIIFDKLGKPFPLENGSEAEMVESVVRAELPDSYGNPAERFLVGTSFSDDLVQARDDIRGRILVLGVDSDRSPYLVATHPLKGSCRMLATIGEDVIVAALLKTVVVYRYEETSTTTGKLIRLASYRPSTYPVDLAIHNNMIAVVDLMKSLSLVEYIPAQDGNPAQLVEQARHYQSAWGTAGCHIEQDSWLEADAKGNLMVLRRNATGVTLEQKRRLEITSELNLGEQVNKIRTINVETGPNALIIPKAFISTVEGAIYMFGTIATDSQDLLLRFQAKLTGLIKTPGNIDFTAYRAFRNQEREGEGPYRFLDGELLERFLDVDEDLQRTICDGLGPSVEHMRNIVEELKRMH